MKYFKQCKDTGKRTPLTHEEVERIFEDLPYPEMAMESLHEMGQYGMMFFIVIAEDIATRGAADDDDIPF
jgi:hypothetical protein